MWNTDFSTAYCKCTRSRLEEKWETTTQVELETEKRKESCTCSEMTRVGGRQSGIAVNTTSYAFLHCRFVKVSQGAIILFSTVGLCV